MVSRIVSIPEEMCRRFDKVYWAIMDLNNEDRETIIDDLITSAENRVKVFQK